MMRIALVSQEYPPQTAHGGIATQTQAKADGLAALGHEVHVISHAPTHERVQESHGRVTVTRIPGFDQEMSLKTDIARWITYSVRIAVELERLDGQRGIDLIDFPDWGNEGYVYLQNRGSEPKPRVVLHLHGPLVMLAHTLGWPDRSTEHFRSGTAMEGACVRSADAILSSSRCSIDWCHRHYGLDPSRVPVLHAGVDVQHFEPRKGLATGERVVLFVGRVARSKGADVLVEAGCRIARSFPRLRLRFVGRCAPVDQSALLAIARERGCDDLLEFVGQVPNARLPAHFHQAEIFAAPSRYEGGPGFVYLEAMACGVPPVGCTGSGVSETIVDGETGWLVPPGDVDALARVLATALDDEALRARIGAGARAHVVEHAAREDCVRRIARFYECVVEGRDD